MTRLAAVAVLAAVTIVASLATLASLGAADTPITGRIELTAVVVEHHVQGVFPGAMETWRLSLSSVRRNAHRPFGYMILACARIGTSTTLQECVGTASLPRGKLTLAGSFLYPVIYGLAVTGGTDDYTGAAGAVAAVQTHASRSVYHLTVELV